MFEFSEELHCFVRKIGGSVFVCSEYKTDYDSLSEKLASQYQLKLQEIALFIKPRIDSFYRNDFPVDMIIDNLGYPTIDVELNTISYVDNKFDEEHTVIVEFDGMLERFLNTIIDG